MLRLWQPGSTVIRVGSHDASLEFPLRGSSWARATVSLSGGRFLCYVRLDPAADDVICWHAISFEGRWKVFWCNGYAQGSRPEPDSEGSRAEFADAIVYAARQDR